MSFNSEGQAANVRPPRHGACLALTVDTTARAYDLTTLALGTALAPDQGVTHSRNVFITMHAETADIYYHFSDAADTDLNEATVISAGGTLAFNDAYGAVLSTGQDVAMRLNRTVDKYLVVKAGSSATLRIWASSDSE